MLYQFCLFKPSKKILGWRTKEEAESTYPWGSLEKVGNFEILEANVSIGEKTTLWSSSIGAIEFRIPSPDDILENNGEE
jgi:hypothetical protein